MKIPPRLLETPKNIAEAAAIQNSLRNKVILEDGFNEIKTIAGIDCSYDIKSNLSYAVIVLVDYKTLKPIHHVSTHLPTEFPYVPGYLSFREIPVILRALDELGRTPDLLMVDGQGISHPRRLGIAAHLGVLLDMPAIGVAKSKLTGHYSEPDLIAGSASPLTDKGEQIGFVLRSKNKVKPLFVSPGHKVSVSSALQITLNCLTKYRLPEPTRLADKISKTIKVPQ